MFKWQMQVLDHQLIQSATFFVSDKFSYVMSY